MSDGRRNSSPIWQYFSVVSTEIAKWYKCGKEVRRAGGTTNLRGHLKSKHFSLYFTLQSGNDSSTVEDEVNVDNPTASESSLGIDSDDSSSRGSTPVPSLPTSPLSPTASSPTLILLSRALLPQSKLT